MIGNFFQNRVDSESSAKQITSSVTSDQIQLKLKGKLKDSTSASQWGYSLCSLKGNSINNKRRKCDKVIEISIPQEHFWQRSG